MDIGINEILADEEELQRLSIENSLSHLRVAMPGIIQDFNPINQTATVQPAIKERINGNWVDLPQLLDVPVYFPRAGGYCMTFPVKHGDECLVVFADMCIDAWWQSSGVQAQLETRRHDLSDAFALIGVTSVPKAVKNYSPASTQFRNEEGNAYVEISEDTITVKANKLIFDIREQIDMTAPNSTINTTLDILGETSIKGNVDVTESINAGGSMSASGNANVKGNINLDGYIDVTQHIKAKEAYIDSIPFTSHKHKGVTSGSDISQEPLKE